MSSATPKTTAADITQATLRSFAQTPEPRTRRLLEAAVKHLHAFATEVNLTTNELIRLAEILTAAGKISDASRHEFLLISDIMGLTMVVDYNTNQKPEGAFESSVLGPFYRADAPWIEPGGDICRQENAGTSTLVSGRILSTEGTPINGAVLDIWQVPANGMYENTDPTQVEFNCRGRLKAAEDGAYRFWTVKPVPYPIPKDGPAGLILDSAERHNMRAAHIHVIVEAPGYEKVISELFVKGDLYIDSDAVFGVKESLIAEFVLHESTADAAAYGRPTPFYTVNYDFVLASGQAREEIMFSAGRA
ncbi:MAG: 6-chlorohydroxyquinol-1,2-dioxygenase [Verrucomicrobia bacterium]|nr:6-chlorohydroxyquinol-1,2-dioxygenase [Verrucomicrobiota bacterium]